ncbi:P-loop containing nucleoside triphosphate hydrolase protein [Leptodontidium sp. MPI-SDFR-AT-0119]|nr:P-loop containing nucleoside triphosphate hydrolase protein [Leptodontidium sp. MPI-SDFR-AT-0119]
MRRSVELFNRSLDACDEPNESRIALVDFLDCMVTILLDMNKYLHDFLSDVDPQAVWTSFNDNIVSQFSELDQSVKHLDEITAYSKVNHESKIKHLFKTHELRPENEEQANFPNFILAERNVEFWGRQDELDLIMKHLDPNDGNAGLKTYMIYGRRGVGKTEIALEFAHTNLKPRGVYDAVFWIQCETTVSIRQSFTEVAVSLNLPGADRDRHHEENLEAVHKWLKRTLRSGKKWLLIFDNAENESILQGYMPVGVNGSILMTSRKYFNFAKDMCRGGETVKQFDEEQSWGLLLKMLGEDWKKKVESPVEMEAAKSMLRQLEGLALGIQQTAVLVKDPEIGGESIEETYRQFRDRIKTLPQRHLSERSTSEKALDALWDITFNALTPEARVLIGVLAWLSPDRISIDLFLPRDQSALDGQLEFCKQDAKDINKQNQASLFSLITPSPAFDRAMDELLKRRLISRDGRYFKIHRVVQEATNYHSIEELQKAFATASKLVFQQFPNREPNETLYRKWNICREYIPHAIHLRMAYSKYSRTGKLKVLDEFVELMSNSGWYLYELGDYPATSLAATTGLQACADKESLVSAELQLIDGCHHYELNQLAECRKSWEESLRVRLKCLDKDHPRLAAIYNNLGNLEVAMGNLDEADEYYTLSMNIWLAGGDSTAEQLAVTYLCIGRFHMLQRNFEEALRYTRLSETLFVRTIGAEMGFMAHVYYAYGNIKLLEKKYNSAWRSYNACLKVALANMPIHPLTASAWFSLGTTEFARGNSELSLYAKDSQCS